MCLKSNTDLLKSLMLNVVSKLKYKEPSYTLSIRSQLIPKFFGDTSLGGLLKKKKKVNDLGADVQ